MRVEEFIKKLLEEGYEVVHEDTRTIILYRPTYIDCHGECEDWEQWVIDKNTGEATKTYGSNRSVPGWTMCPHCGEWHSYNEEQYHEDCEPERIFLEVRA